MKNKKLPFIEAGALLLGELVVSLLVCGVYLLLDLVFDKAWFSYKVITGAALGTLIITLNYFFLSFSVNRAFDRALEARGEGDMSEEEIEAFTAKYQGEIQNTIKLSQIIRTLSMLAALVVAFLLEYFDVIATLVPFLMMRPIITLKALIFRNKEGA